MTKTQMILSLAALAGAIAGCTLDSSSVQRFTGVLGAGQQWINAENLSSKDEDSIGQSVAAAITAQHPPVANTNLQHYVNLVGITVSDASPARGGNWLFGVIESPEVNAFSGPNGYVLVTRGAMQQMRDEAELAGVLAHEVAHVCNHDGLEQVKANQKKGAMVNFLKAADTRTAQLAVYADNGIDVITRQGYSQPQELKADADAVRIMYAAGYDPTSYLHFLQRLQSMGAGGPQGGQLMSTHPGIAQRISTVDAAIRSLPRTPGQASIGATLAARYTNNFQWYGGTTPTTGSPVAPLQPVYPQPATPVFPPGRP